MPSKSDKSPSVPDFPQISPDFPRFPAPRFWKRGKFGLTRFRAGRFSKPSRSVFPVLQPLDPNYLIEYARLLLWIIRTLSMWPDAGAIIVTP